MKNNLIKPAFTPTRLEEERAEDKRRVVPVSLNEEEQERLNVSKKTLQQPKDSTAIKLLAEIGMIVLHDPLMGKIISSIFINKAKNKRTGHELIE